MVVSTYVRSNFQKTEMAKSLRRHPLVVRSLDVISDKLLTACVGAGVGGVIGNFTSAGFLKGTTYGIISSEVNELIIPFIKKYGGEEVNAKAEMQRLTGCVLISTVLSTRIFALIGGSIDYPSALMITSALSFIQLHQKSIVKNIPVLRDYAQLQAAFNMKLIGTLDEGNEILVLLALSNEKLISGNSKGQIKIWDISNNNSHCRLTLSSDNTKVTTLACHENDILASGGHDLEVKIWKLSTGECLHTLKTDSYVINLYFLKDGTLVCVGNDTIELWDACKGERKSSKQVYEESARCITVSALNNNEVLITGDNSRYIKLWNISKVECQHTIDVGNYVESVCALPDETFISRARYGKVEVRNISTGQLQRTLESEEDTAHIALPDRILACLRFSILMRGVNLVSLDTGKYIRSFSLTRGADRSLTCLPNGTLVIGSQTKITLWR
jgi:WD40 repeat protein